MSEGPGYAVLAEKREPSHGSNPQRLGKVEGLPEVEAGADGEDCPDKGKLTMICPTESVAVSFLSMIFDRLPKNALEIAANIAHSNCPSGRTMHNTPMKPITVAVQRRTRTASPSRNTDPTMDHSGAEKESATASARSSRFRAKASMLKAITENSARNRWTPGRPVRNCPGPMRTSQGREMRRTRA
jgi:hypothetical protein